MSKRNDARGVSLLAGWKPGAPSVKRRRETTTPAHLEASGNSTADLDVIAYSTASKQWTHFLLGSYSGGAAGCNFWGLIIPPGK